MTNPAPGSSAANKHRWVILALLFFATTINYLDRNVLGLLKPVLSAGGVFGDDKAAQELNYSTVVICFQIAYAVGMLAAGRFIDWVGTISCGIDLVTQLSGKRPTGYVAPWWEFSNVTNELLLERGQEMLRRRELQRAEEETLMRMQAHPPARAVAAVARPAPFPGQFVPDIN
mgnify:CR=1 FL=1